MLGALVAIATFALFLSLLWFASAPMEATGATGPAARCHTVTAATYNRQVRRLERIERLNVELPDRKRGRATRKVCKHTLYRAVVRRVEQVCKPVFVIRGKTSVFNDYTTASKQGYHANIHEGLAVNLKPGTTKAGWNNSTVRGWMNRGAKFKLVFKGVARVTKIIDLGPREDTERALDFSDPLAEAMGQPTGWSFPTDSYGSLYRYRYGCR